MGKQNKIKEYKGKNFALLIYNSKYYSSGSNGSFFDHIALFESENKKRIFITQPYIDLNDKRLEQAKECFEKVGLEITNISKELSWHYPGSTILIQIELRDESLFKKFLMENKDQSHHVPFPFN
ncbi:MAG TPA: hypothetical protein VF941_23010 [Clostridia bacterium]